MAEYAWREGYRPPIEANVFGAEFERIAGEKGGYVLPADIVAAANDPKSPLRPALLWDDAKAAHAHRMQQARQMLGALVVTRVEFSAGSNLPTKAVYRVVGSDGSGYASAAKILGDADLTRNLISSARRELEAYIRRFQGSVAFGRHVAGLQASIDAMRDHLDEIEQAAKRRTEARRHTEDPVP